LGVGSIQSLLIIGLMAGTIAGLFRVRDQYSKTGKVSIKYLHYLMGFVFVMAMITMVVGGHFARCPYC